MSYVLFMSSVFVNLGLYIGKILGMYRENGQNQAFDRFESPKWHFHVNFNILILKMPPNCIQKLLFLLQKY